MQRFVIPLSLAALAAVPAAAQDKPFAGPSVTAIVGAEVGKELGRDRNGVVYGGQIGYDIQRNGLVLGVEGEIAGASSKTCFGIANPGDRYCTKADRDIYAGGRLGYVTSPTTMVYGKLGYVNGREGFDYRDGGTGTRNYSGSGTRDGVRIGAGVEKRITGNAVVKAEYRYSDYQAGSDRHQGVVGLGLRF